MIISNQKNALDIKIRETILTKVSTVKFLGVTPDKNLTFKDHVNMVTSNISKSVGVMRLHCLLPANVMVKLYYSLVSSMLSISKKVIQFLGEFLVLPFKAWYGFDGDPC